MTNSPWNGECLKCKSPHAYVGYNQIECPTKRCENFSVKQQNLVEQELKDIEATEREYDPCQLSLPDIPNKATVSSKTTPWPVPNGGNIWGLFGPTTQYNSGDEEEDEENPNDVDKYPYDVPADLDNLPFD